MNDKYLIGEKMDNKYKYLIGAIILCVGIFSTYLMVEKDLMREKEIREVLFEGTWILKPEHYLIPAPAIYGLYGPYTAYRNENGSIVLEGRGKLESGIATWFVMPDEIYDTTPGESYRIESLFTQEGNNTRRTFFLNETQIDYKIYHNITVDRLVELLRKGWEGRLTKHEEEELDRAEFGYDASKF